MTDHDKRSLSEDEQLAICKEEMCMLGCGTDQIPKRKSKDQRCWSYEWKIFDKSYPECKMWLTKMKGDGKGEENKCYQKDSGGHLSWFIAKDMSYMRQIVRDLEMRIYKHLH